MGWIDANTYRPESRPVMRSIFDSGRRTQSDIDFVVIHSAETQEGENTAEAIGSWFQNKANKGKGSTHKGVDGGFEGGIIQYVPDDYVAHGAAGGNHNGLHLEIAGRASQSRADWLDAYSRRALDRAALITAEWAVAYNLPLVWLTPDDLRRGLKGITTHNAIRIAFGKTSHTDPGPFFPGYEFMELVRNWHGFIMALNPAVDKTPSPIAFKVAVVARGAFDTGIAETYAYADALKFLPEEYGHVKIGTAILVGGLAHDTEYISRLQRAGVVVVAYAGKDRHDTARWVARDLRRGYRQVPGIDY